ncbi:hypothetical protein BC835DRAFT_1527334 [Cytidiella melzeri]|nr:hypothetical protein BC835DRAFT_1527334 [Cytidiella melzeri]
MTELGTRICELERIEEPAQAGNSLSLVGADDPVTDSEAPCNQLESGGKWVSASKGAGGLHPETNFKGMIGRWDGERLALGAVVWYLLTFCMWSPNDSSSKCIQRVQSGWGNTVHRVLPDTIEGHWTEGSGEHENDITWDQKRMQNTAITAENVLDKWINRAHRRSPA